MSRDREGTITFTEFERLHDDIYVPKALSISHGEMLLRGKFGHTNEPFRSGGQSVVVPYGKYAIKVFHKRYIADGVRERTLVNEISRRLRVQVIATLRASAMMRGVPILAYTLMWGDFINLAELFHSKKRSWDLLAYTQRAGEGLEYLHDARVVHGDIKPDNILVGDNGQVFLSDLSFASIEGVYRGKAGGTVGYCTAERHTENKGVANCLDDWFGLAVTCVVMLSGQAPGSDSSHNEVTRWARHALSHNKALSVEKCQGVMQMLTALALTYKPYPPPGCDEKAFSTWFSGGILTAQGVARIKGVNLVPVFST